MKKWNFILNMSLVRSPLCMYVYVCMSIYVYLCMYIHVYLCLSEHTRLFHHLKYTHETHKQTGGIVGDEFDNNKQQPGTRLPTVSVAKLLRDFKAPKVIDYLSLDIEGAEAWVFDTFPWDEYIFLVITVERPAERLMQAMKDNGYIYMCDHSCFGDQMWIHSSLENMAEVQAKYQGPLGNYCPGTGFVKGYKRHNYTMEMIEKFTPPEVLLASAEKKE